MKFYIMPYQKKSCAEKALHQLQKCLNQIEDSIKNGCNVDQSILNSAELLRAEVLKLKIQVEEERKIKNTN